jgi:hypothetical protein
MEIQGYCDKETQYRNTSAIHHASDLAFEPIDLYLHEVGVDLGVWYSIRYFQ